MFIKQSDYETLLADYSNRDGAIALLKKYRSYLELLPSMRRPEESIITIPLPVVRIRHSKPLATTNSTKLEALLETICLPCDLAILMCDPEWKIKMGVEMFIFIHRPHEDFSDLLSRWRQTQVLLDKDYQWLMPPGYEHVTSEKVEHLYPLFVVLPETPERIRRGLLGASLPFVIQMPDDLAHEEISEILSPDLS